MRNTKKLGKNPWNFLWSALKIGQSNDDIEVQLSAICKKSTGPIKHNFGQILTEIW